mgnify:CR=1 FL=1
MGQRIAITGKPGCGKTTLCRRLAREVEGLAGGLLTEEIREKGRRVGFKLEDLSTGEQGLLSHVDKCSGPSVGRYSVCLVQLRSIGVSAIERALEEKELLIVDEIGPMELKSDSFVDTIRKALRWNGDLLFTIHRRSNHPLLREIRDDFQVEVLNRDNREEVFQKVIAVLGDRE